MQKCKKSTSKKLQRSLQRNTAAKNITAALTCVCVCICVCVFKGLPLNEVTWAPLCTADITLQQYTTKLWSDCWGKERRNGRQTKIPMHTLRVKIKSKGCLKMTRKGLKYQKGISPERLCMLGAERDIQCEKWDCNWELGNLVRKFWKLIKNLLEGKMY